METLVAAVVAAVVVVQVDGAVVASDSGSRGHVVPKEVTTELYRRLWDCPLPQGTVSLLGDRGRHCCRGFQRLG